MIEIIQKQKIKLYEQRIRKILQRFLAFSTASDSQYIDRYLSAIKVMDIEDPGRLPCSCKASSGTKREAFFALLSRLITKWWEYSREPGKESELLNILKEVEKLHDIRYLQCEVKGNQTEGFCLEIPDGKENN